MGMTQTPLTLRRWQRAEYDRLVHLGVFEGEPIELIGAARRRRAAAPLPRVRDQCRGVRAESRAAAGLDRANPGAVSLDDESEPEPDLVVVRGRPADYRESHPARPALAIEVAESSLAFDRHGKGSLYARAGIEDYWIVNLVDLAMEVYRDPEPDASAVYGWRYRSVRVLVAPAVIVPLAFPSCQVAVADLLP